MSAEKLNAWYLTGGAPSFMKTPAPSELQVQRCKLMLSELVSKANKKKEQEVIDIDGKTKQVEAEADVEAAREEAKEEILVGSKRRLDNNHSDTEVETKGAAAENTVSSVSQTETGKLYMGMPSSQPDAKKKKSIIEDVFLLLEAVRDEKSRTNGFQAKLLESL